MKPQIHFHFITLFPETISVWLKTSILGRAHLAGLFSFHTYQLRDFSIDKHRTVDDVAYGGGGGMVLKLEPLVAAVESLWEKLGRENTTTLYFSPAGAKMDQRLIQEMKSKETNRHLILICGHYEGVDQRFVDRWVDKEISLGDFVLTGGELPAVALADALIRQFDGVLGLKEGSQTESFLLGALTQPLLEYPHYTRPQEFRGLRVPEILTSGDHQKIASWRDAQAKTRTESLRPDLLKPEGPAI